MSTEMFIASPQALPSIETLASWFADTGGAEVHPTGGIILAQTTAIEKVPLSSAPSQVRALPAARRKIVLRAYLGDFDSIVDLAQALGGTVFSEGGERLESFNKPKPPTKRARSPKIDISVPAEIHDALVGHYLPVLAVREKWSVKIQKVGAACALEQRRQIRYSRVGARDFGVGRLDALIVTDTSFYARELAALGLTGIVEIVRVVPSEWYAEPRTQDEELALAILCALARLSRGVIYSRPGGRKLQATVDDAIPFVFDFAI